MNRITALSAACLLAAFSTQTFAGTVYWDIDGATAGGSGSTAATGVWDQNTTARWSTSSLGDVATDTFFNTGGATPDAVFSAGADVTGASTVTITGSVSANSILVEEGNVTFAGASTPVLTLGGGTGAGITIASTASTTANTSFGATVTSIVLNGAQSWDVINSTRTLSTNAATVITGAGPLTINGASDAMGTVILGNNTGASNFTGGVNVKGGVLQIDSSAGAGQISSAGTGTITLGDTTGSRDVTLRPATNTSKTFNNAIVIASGNTGTITISGYTGNTVSQTWAGGITMNKAVTLSVTGSNSVSFTTNTIVTNGNTITAKTTGSGKLNISAPITGSGGLVVESVGGTGWVLLTGSNTGWSGPITVNTGVLGVGDSGSGAFALGTGPISLASGTTLTFAGSNGNGTNYQNGTVTIASGSATINSPGSSGRLRAIGNIDLGAGGTGSTVLFDPVIQTVASSGLRLLGNSVIDVSPTGTATGLINIYGGISDSGGNYGFTKTGTGILTLGGSTLAVTDVPALTGVASTYHGDTNIAGGILRAGSTNALPTGTKVSIASGAVFSFVQVPGNVGTGNFDQEVAGLSDYSGGGGTVAANDTGTNLATKRTLTLSGSGNYAFSGNIVNATGTGSGNLALVKTGTGTQTLGGTNSYTNTTTVNNGTLLISSTGSLTGTSGVSVTGGTFRYDGTTALDRNVTVNGGKFSYNSSNNYTGTLTFTAGTIGGSNISNLNLSIGTGQTMSPGNSTGTMAAGATTWATGGTFLFELNDTTGTAGSTSAGWDLLNAASLNITAGVGEFTIQIASLDNLQAAGNALNFDGTSNYTWLFVDAGAAITGFNASSFILDDSAFGNSTPGSFSITQGTGGDVDKLYLNYTGVIPEPTTYAMLVGGLGLLAFLRRRSKA